MSEMQFIFGSVFLLANKLQIAGDKITEELTTKQWFLLVMISKMDKELPSMTDIANFTGSTRQNITKMLLILEKKGYITISTLPEDKKSMRVTLTEKCGEHFASKEKSGNELLEKIFAGISLDKLRSVSEVFMAMFENLDIIMKLDIDSKIQPKDIYQVKLEKE